jgi:hypothetical protein
MRLFVMVCALTLACAAVAMAADSCTPSNTCPSATCPSKPCPSATCPSSTCPSSPCAVCPSTTGTQSVDNCLMRTFGLTAQQLSDLRNQGYSNKDIAVAAAIAKKACVSINDVLTSYRECKDWNSAASKYNVRLADMVAMADKCLCPQQIIGAGPCACYAMYNKTGNVLLTQAEAFRYYAMGYDWMDVALAANIAMETGYPIGHTLMDIRRGVLYEEIALTQGVPYNRAFNFTCYPFQRQSKYSPSVQEKNMNKFARYQVATECPGTSSSPMITSPTLRPSY